VLGKGFSFWGPNREESTLLLISNGIYYNGVV
jgi:hypothetical protein